MSSQDLQDPKCERKSLKTLQHTASDRENLIGRSSKNLKHQNVYDTPPDTEIKKKVSNKETQASFTNKLTNDDLTGSKGSLKYWRILAKKRYVTLQRTLEENAQLRGTINELNKQISEYKVMLEEANSFIDVVKEELASDSRDDTGIDVNDVSTADENGEDIEPELETQD